MGGHGGRPVEEDAKGIVWAATLSDNGPSGSFSKMVYPNQTNLLLKSLFPLNTVNFFLVAPYFNLQIQYLFQSYNPSKLLVAFLIVFTTITVNVQNCFNNRLS